MIRINLLPTAKRREASPSNPEGVRVLGVLGVLIGVGLIVGLFFFHSGKQRELEQAKSANENISGETRAIRARIGDHKEVLAKIDEIQEKQIAIQELQAARTGPTSMLVELSHLLSPGGAPSIDPLMLERIERDQMYNRDWETHRVWLVRLEEKDREVTILGAGRYPDDVGEFMQRLKLSRYFETVSLQETRDHMDEASKILVQRFTITARVKY